jgi:ATP-dependent DNA ligase
LDVLAGRFAPDHPRRLRLSRYPWIVESALKNRYRQFVVDGEAVVLGIDGVADFNALQSGRHDTEVQLYAFDITALDGGDVLRARPLSMRKSNLARLFARRPDGIFVAPFEQGEIGPDLFRHACLMGLEGLVSKHREHVYGAGRCTHWVKVKDIRRIGGCRISSDCHAEPFVLVAFTSISPPRARSSLSIRQKTTRSKQNCAA